MRPRLSNSTEGEVLLWAVTIFAWKKTAVRMRARDIFTRGGGTVGGHVVWLQSRQRWPRAVGGDQINYQPQMPGWAWTVT